LKIDGPSRTQRIRMARFLHASKHAQRLWGENTTQTPSIPGLSEKKGGGHRVRRIQLSKVGKKLSCCNKKVFSLSTGGER